MIHQELKSIAPADIPGGIGVDPVVGKKEVEVRRQLPFWAEELLKMWQNAEKSYKDRGSSG